MLAAMIELDRSRCFSPAVLALACLTGCSSGDGLPREAVSGKVTLDGKPLASGSIRFSPVGGGDAKNPALSGGATIMDGAYDIPRESGLTPNKYSVAITSAEGGAAAAANEPPGPAQKPAKEAIPEKYNKASVLDAEVTPGGANTFNFDLSSK
jgi:hypothetical protein